MQPFKIQLKLGQFEFSAEGDEATVKDQLATFMAFVNRAPSQPPTPAQKDQPPAPAPDASFPGIEDKLAEDLSKIFVNEKNALSLRIHPEGDGAKAARKSMVLVLYGYKVLLGKEDVGVTIIAESLRRSGIKFYRIGEMADPLYQEGLITKMGKSKGVEYRITNKGSNFASTVIEELRPRF